MIGNAVPVQVAKILANRIHYDLSNIKVTKKIISKQPIKILNGQNVIEKMNKIVNKASV